jgi:MraZ protein
VEKYYFYLGLGLKIRMITFSNIYPVTVDDKGRVVMPAPFKKEMGEAMETTFVVEKDVYDRCLNVYPYSTWLTKVERLRQRLNMDDPVHSKMLSRYYEEIAKIGMAENGRLNIPGEMLSYAGIKKEAVFTGQGSRMRLWEPERHQASRLNDEEYARLYKELLGGPID